MAQNRPQTFENHARFVPPYHIGMILIFVANLVWAAWKLFRSPGVETVMGLLLALGFCGIVWYMRIFPLTVQNRVIRLEMRLRLAKVLPEDLRGRIGELKVGQLIALRFAGDDELPELVRQVLDEDLQDRGEIKRRIQSWQADYLRL